MKGGGVKNGRHHRHIRRCSRLCLVPAYASKSASTEKRERGRHSSGSPEFRISDNGAATSPSPTHHVRPGEVHARLRRDVPQRTPHVRSGLHAASDAHLQQSLPLAHANARLNGAHRIPAMNHDLCLLQARHQPHQLMTNPTAIAKRSITFSPPPLSPGRGAARVAVLGERGKRGHHLLGGDARLVLNALEDSVAAWSNIRLLDKSARGLELTQPLLPLTGMKRKVVDALAQLGDVLLDSLAAPQPSRRPVDPVLDALPVGHHTLHGLQQSQVKSLGRRAVEAKCFIKLATHLCQHISDDNAGALDDIPAEKDAVDALGVWSPAHASTVGRLDGRGGMERPAYLQSGK